MLLRRLRLQNFRQHADTEIALGSGITGIIGANGTGKSTLLEAIAWAMYGNQAARGDKDSIRNFRAKGRAPVRVEVDFTLGHHEYRVERSLSAAELYQDGARVASTLTAVTERVGRLLGMQHQEFFNTYFTGQKELAVMSAMKPGERAQFLSRVLGYEKLRLAQEELRDRRSALTGELKGLEQGLSDPEEIAAQIAEAEERVAGAKARLAAAEDRRQRAETAFREEEPRWKAISTRRDRMRALEGDLKMAEQAVEMARLEFQRLDRELAEALQARDRYRELAVELTPLEKLKSELAQLDRLLREETDLRADEAQRDEARRAREAIEERLTRLGDATTEAAGLETRFEAEQTALAALDRQLEEKRAAWVRDKQDAETKRQSLRDQYRDVKEQLDTIERQGADGVCPTCQRPLGDEYTAVVGLLQRQLEEIEINGRFFKQRVDQLVEEPPEIAELERTRLRQEESVRLLREDVGAAKTRAAEAASAAQERRRLAEHLHDLDGRIAARPRGYDAERHGATRAELAKLEPVALEAARLAARADRAEALVKEAEVAEKSLTQRETQMQHLATAVAADGYAEEEFVAARQRFEEASRAHREAVEDVAAARGELVGAEAIRIQAQRRQDERTRRAEAITEHRRRVRLHNEVDRALSDLRTDLNQSMRPDIGELASSYLAELTDGRYTELDLTEDYELQLMEDDVFKPVISGGEEDVANLVLRLAISQMIAERAGQALNLLVLDEVFGSLDETRRQNVVDLLRRLRDRFPQVILITHIEQVREGLDRVLRVEFDPGKGTAVVRDETETLGAGGAAGASVAA
jgi:DNA repair protein SbcC/Rad50